MEKKKSQICGIVLLFSILTIGLRLIYLDTSLWYDEACSWFTAIQDFPMGIMDNLLHLDLQHTPLYFFLLHFWIKLFGDSELAMKVLSMIFGIATVPLVCVVAQKLSSKIVSLMIASLVMVSPILVFFSEEVRMYPIVTFLVLLSLNFVVDFEQKGDNKTLVKLVLTNLLIPYTLIGGILYNVLLMICYGRYLHRNYKEKFQRYFKAIGAELICLVPYFVLLFYYAKMRSLFVIKHEGIFYFFHLVDVIRNFFGVTLVDNVYWPDKTPYFMTFAFALLVILPCSYFVYGLVQGVKRSEGFIRVLYYIFFSSLLLSLVFAIFQVNVFTVRYILYLLPPFFILSVIGLSNKLTLRHLKIFVLFFVASSVIYNIKQVDVMKELKEKAFKAVRMECDELKLGKDDIVIMPFGADAPYYFRTSESPRVWNFDFHKEVRNPYNDRFYDKAQQKIMTNNEKYQLVYDSVFTDKGFSDNHFELFVRNVNQSVPTGRYVLIAMYGSDIEAVVQLEDLRKSIVSLQDVKDNLLSVMLKKYMVDLIAYLQYDFDFVGQFQKDNYTYIFFQKK